MASSETVKMDLERREDMTTPTKELPNTLDTLTYTAEEEKKLVRKIDMCLLPCLAFTYGLQFLDKQALSVAAVIGLIKDTKLVGTDYSLLTTIFYIGMIVTEYPVNVGLQKLRPGKFAAILVILWGLSLSCMAGSHNFGALAACRFFLGAFEAVIGPALMLFTSTWYRRREHPLRVGLWYSFQGLAICVGGLLGYGVQKWGGPLKAWQSLFLFTGVLTVGWGFALLVLLPDSIETAYFLTERQKAILKDRLAPEKTANTDRHFRWNQVWDAFQDPKYWLITLFAFSANWVTSMNAFSPLIVKGLGFSSLNTVLLNAIAGLFNVGAILTFSLISTHFKNTRCFCMAFAYIVGITGALMLLYVPTSQPWTRLAGVWFTAVAPAGFTMSLSVATSNTMGSTKKAITNGSVFLGFALGNLVAPQLYLSDEAPHYHTGLYGVLSFSCIAATSALALYAYLRWENGRRDRLQRQVDQNIQLAEGMDNDRTDRQDLSFRYMM